LFVKRTNVQDGINVVYKTEPLNKSFKNPDYLDDKEYNPTHAPYRITHATMDNYTMEVNYNTDLADFGSKDVNITQLDIHMDGQTLNEYDIIYKETDGRTFKGDNIRELDSLVFIENKTIIEYDELNPDNLELLNSNLDMNGTVYLRSNNKTLEEINMTYSEEHSLSNNDGYDFRTYYDYNKSKDNIELNIYGFSYIGFEDYKYRIEYGQETIYINSSKWISGNYGPDNPLTINLDRQDNKDIISIYHIDNYENEKKSRVVTSSPA
jgi:hypothetical protein